MIKAFLLIFEPAMTWDKIAQARKSMLFIFLVHLTPLIALSVAAELFGLAYFGRQQDFGERVKLARKLLIIYGAAQLVLSLVVVFVSAKLMKAIAETFHGRHNYAQCFTVAAYAFAPLFLVRMCDAFPSMNPWATFGIGIVLSVTTLYQGVPRVLQPDPPHAFGLYVSSALLLAIASGLGRFLALLVLQQKIHL